MANKRTKERHETSGLDEIDKLEIQSKKKQHQESEAKKNRLSNAPKAKEKWSFVENKKTGAKGKEKWIAEHGKIGGKTPVSGRTTLNSRCGTDRGVFDQVTNNGGEKTRNSTAITMTDDNVGSKRNNGNNVETNGQRASNTSGSMEQETIVMNIKQENPTDDQDEEIQILKEYVVKTTIMDIKQEKPSYQGTAVFTLVNENTEENNRSLMRPVRELSGHEQIHACKETLISTPTDKYLAGASAFPSITRLPQSPGRNKTSHSLDFYRSGLTITPVGPSAANSFCTSSEAGETTRRIHYGATRSRGSSPDCNRSGDINGTTPKQNTSPVNNGLSQNGTTPVVPLATNSFAVSSEAGEKTRYIHYGATMFQRNSSANDITGRRQDGATTNDRSGDNTGHNQDAAAISLSKSPISNASGDITGRAEDGATVNNRNGDFTGRTQDVTTTSQSNSLVNNGSGDSTGRTQHGATASQSNSRVNNGLSQDGATASRSNSRVNNGSGDDTRSSQDEATASQSNTRDMTGRIHDGATASQGNSSGNTNDRRDMAERVNNEVTNQSTRSHGNLTINIGGGDLTLNNGTQMKFNDVNMTGPADDVTNFVIKATRAVRDLVNDN